MALVKCKECGKEYSTDAKACPNCGKRRTTMTTTVIMGLFAFVIIIFIFNSQQKQDAESARRAALTPEQRATEDAAKAKAGKFSSARGACLIVLEKNLNDPDSAKLERTSSWYVEERKDGTILVLPSGRAKNTFGAYINGVWECVVKPEGEYVQVLSLKQISP